jgi:hypothetical protein
MLVGDQHRTMPPPLEFHADRHERLDVSAGADGWQQDVHNVNKRSRVVVLQ